LVWGKYGGKRKKSRPSRKKEGKIGDPPLDFYQKKVEPKEGRGG